MANRTLVAGRGINDSEYPTQARMLGRVYHCPYFTAWCRMMRSKDPVSPAWLRFSVFAKWMHNQDWHNRQIDRYLFGDGKLYGPETCCFLSKDIASAVRSLRLDLKKGIDQPLGLSASKPFRAVVNGRHVGYFESRGAAQRATRSTRRQIILGALADYNNGIQKALMELCLATDSKGLSTRT